MKKLKCLMLCFIFSLLFMSSEVVNAVPNTGGTTLLIQGVSYTPAPLYTPDPVYTYAIDFLGSDVMPLSGFYWPFTTYNINSTNGNVFPNLSTKEYYELIKEAGVNTVAVNPERYGVYTEIVTKQLEICDELGIAYFVHDSDTRNVVSKDNLKARLDKYYSYDSCAGVFVNDEPVIKTLVDWGTPNAYKWHDELAAEYGEPYKSRALMINLYPSYADNYAGDGTPMSFKQYLETFLTLTNSKILSSNYYCYLQPEQGTNRTNGYFAYLSTMRTVSNAFEVPFWNYVQTGGQWDRQGKSSLGTFPNEAEFLWNVNTTLAYGCKGIEYFTISQPIEFSRTNDENNPDFGRIGLLGAVGNKTQWYYYTQKANKQIAAIDHILMNATNKGVIRKGYLESYLNSSEVVNSFRELTSVNSTIVNSDTDGALIGCFDYQGRTALYVVNASVKNKGQITLNFNGNYGYEVIQRAKSVNVVGNSITLTLEAGEGVMVRLLP